MAAGGKPSPDGKCEDCTCPPGFTAEAHGVCMDSLSAEECPAGTRPALGEEGCVPVGVTTCAAGFQLRASGWGCEAIVADTLCEGATREALGSPGCVPIGDCDAVFPPADATHFVDDDFTAAELDDFHFATVTDALAVAPSGSVIAVEEGTYLEGLLIDKSVTVAGRCAEAVRIESDGSMAAGLQAQGYTDVSVRGVTLRGHRGAVVAVGASVEILDCLLEDSRELGVASLAEAYVTLRGSRIAGVESAANGSFGFGVFVQDGGQVDLVESVVTHAHLTSIALDSPTGVVRVERSIIQHTQPDAAGEGGKGIVATDGTATIVESLIRDNTFAGVSIEFPTASVRVERSVIERTRPHSSGAGGHGLESFGGTLHVEDSTLAHNAGISPSGGGILVNGPGDVSVEDGAVVASAEGGIVLQDGERAQIVRSLVHEVVPGSTGVGLGVSVLFGSDLVMHDSAIVGATTVGLVVGSLDDAATPSHAMVTQSIVMSTHSDSMGQFGRGIQVVGALELIDSAVVDNQEVGVFAGGLGTTARLEETLVRTTSLEPDSQFFGHGVIVFEGALAHLSGGALVSNADGGLLVAGAGALVAGVDLVDNRVGIHVQSGTSLEEVSELPAEPTANQVAVDAATRFIDNGARVGSGVLPIPALY